MKALDEQILRNQESESSYFLIYPIRYLHYKRIRIKNKLHAFSKHILTKPFEREVFIHNFNVKTFDRTA